MPDIFDFVGGGVLVVFLFIVIVVLVVLYVSSRYKVAGANEALIRSGGVAGRRTDPRTSRSSVAAASSWSRSSTASASSS